MVIVYICLVSGSKVILFRKTTGTFILIFILKKQTAVILLENERICIHSSTKMAVS